MCTCRPDRARTSCTPGSGRSTAETAAPPDSAATEKPAGAPAALRRAAVPARLPVLQPAPSPARPDGRSGPGLPLYVRRPGIRLRHREGLTVAVVDRGLKLGALLMPSHPPERPIGGGQGWDLEEIERLDRLGFAEASIGEPFTAA